MSFEIRRVRYWLQLQVVMQLESNGRVAGPDACVKIVVFGGVLWRIIRSWRLRVPRRDGEERVSFQLFRVCICLDLCAWLAPSLQRMRCGDKVTNRRRVKVKRLESLVEHDSGHYLCPPQIVCVWWP
ncbi:unnamed protein product, partial [Hapterophycus canaliculatus]